MNMLTLICIHQENKVSCQSHTKFSGHGCILKKIFNFNLFCVLYDTTRTSELGMCSLSTSLAYVSFYSRQSFRSPS